MRNIRTALTNSVNVQPSHSVTHLCCHSERQRRIYAFALLLRWGKRGDRRDVPHFSPCLCCQKGSGKRRPHKAKPRTAFVRGVTCPATSTLSAAVKLPSAFFSVPPCFRGEDKSGRLSPPRRGIRGRGHPRHANYVPSLHPARYSSCSGVSLSILMPMDSSFSFATRRSSSSGTL